MADELLALPPMILALHAAREAATRGEVPVGAVVTASDGEAGAAGEAGEPLEAGGAVGDVFAEVLVAAGDEEAGEVLGGHGGADRG